MSAAEPAFNRPALEQLLGKRFFYAPAFSLYGGNFFFQFCLVQGEGKKAMTLVFVGTYPSNHKKKYNTKETTTATQQPLTRI